MNGLSVCSSEMVGKLVEALTNKSSPIIIIMTDSFQAFQPDDKRYYTVYILNEEATHNVITLVNAEQESKDYFVSIIEETEEKNYD